MTAGQNPPVEKRQDRNQYDDIKPSLLCYNDCCYKGTADLITFAPGRSNIILNINPIQP